MTARIRNGDIQKAIPDDFSQLIHHPSLFREGGREGGEGKKTESLPRRLGLAGKRKRNQQDPPNQPSKRNPRIERKPEFGERKREDERKAGENALATQKRKKKKTRKKERKKENQAPKPTQSPKSTQTPKPTKKTNTITLPYSSIGIPQNPRF